VGNAILLFEKVQDIAVLLDFAVLNRLNYSSSALPVFSGMFSIMV